MKQADHEAICRALVDRGNLIEAGFQMLRYSSIDASAPQIQVDEMRMAFFAGAQHLYASILSILEPGQEATAKDLERMTVIATELDKFVQELRDKGRPQGRVQ